MQPSTSSSICSGVQKMCASSCENMRTRVQAVERADELVAVERAASA